MSWRRLRVLLEQLPRDSATVRAVNGEAAMWGPAEHLLAAVIDVLQHGNWQRAAINMKSPPRKPKPFPRPAARPARATSLPADETRRRLLEQRKRIRRKRGE